MNTNQINPEFGQRAVSVYASNDALDDFPVLKAFQQYIDAEQAKARKRLLAMGVFFGALMLVVIAIFVALLVSVSSRNQQLNDRLIEFAMKERQPSSSVVVQPPQDSAAVLALTAKLEDLQRKVSEAQGKADKAVAEAAEKARQAAVAAEAAKAQAVETAEQREIRRLKAQLENAQKQAAAEKEKRREEELEAYRRKHYPELYAPRQDAPRSRLRQPAVVAPAAETAVRSSASPSRPAARGAVDQVLADLDLLEQTDLEPTEELPAKEDNRPQKDSTASDEEKPASVAGEDRHAISVKTGQSDMTWGIPD